MAIPERMTARLYALVIDDERDITALVAEVLRQEGWEVTEAGSAEEAFTILQSRNWGAVFCDVILGGADGFSVLRRFKKNMPATPVVLMTGHASASSAMDAGSLGAYDYLTKPFDLRKLQLLSRALKEQVLNYTEDPTKTSQRSLHVSEEVLPLSVVEGQHVAKALAHTRGNKQAAARLLEVDRKTLDRMIKRHKIEKLTSLALLLCYLA